MEESLVFSPYIIDQDHISGNNPLSPDFESLSVSDDSCLQSKGVFQAVDYIAGMVFLNETDAGIQ